MFRHATSGGGDGGGLELDDELSEFITSLTGSCDDAAAAAAAPADGGSGLAAALATAALGAAPDGRPPAGAARDSPPSVGAQPRLSFPSAVALEALQAATPPPRAATDRGIGAAANGAPPRLRRSHTFTSSLAPPPEPHAAPMSARKRPVAHVEAEDAAAAEAAIRHAAAMRHRMPRASAGSFMDMMSADDAPPVRPAGVRRSASMPMAFTQPSGGRGAAAQHISDLLHGSGNGSAAAAAAAAMAARDAEAYFAASAGGSSASYGLIPEWAREREGAGSAPQLSAEGQPLFPVPGPPPPGARPTSGYRGVSRAPWSTRWDAHVPAAASAAPAAAPAKTHFCGSFDAEERAARAHDLALLKLHGAAAAAHLCNFGLTEYPGWEEMRGVPDAEFLDAIVASAYEPTERRYSKYRGVFRPRGAPKGAPVAWEGRLEEAPASVAAHATATTFSN